MVRYSTSRHVNVLFMTPMDYSDCEGETPSHKADSNNVKAVAPRGQNLHKQAHQPEKACSSRNGEQSRTGPQDSTALSNPNHGMTNDAGNEPPKPNRGRGKGPEQSGPKCKYCTGRYADNDHHIKDCTRAMHCSRCHFNGHDASACGARSPKTTCTSKNPSCPLNHSRNDSGVENQVSHSVPRDDRPMSELSKKEKKARRAKLKEQRKETQKNYLSTLTKQSSEEALTKTPIIASTPNTCGAKVGEVDPLEIDSDSETVTDVEESDEEIKITIAKPAPPPKNHVAVLEHYWQKDKTVRHFFLPNEETFRTMLLWWLVKFVVVMILNSFGVPDALLTLIELCLIVHTIFHFYFCIFVNKKLVLRMQSNFISDNELPDDYRTDVQKISELKHSKPVLYRAEFSWHCCDLDANIESTSPLPDHFIISPNGQLTNLQFFFKILRIPLVKSPPLPMIYSAEAAAQFVGPNNFDLSGGESETETRINYTLRNLGSVANDRFHAINHNSIIRDAAIASVIMSHDERWRKNALTLN